jgi:hypothetical protein
MAKKIKMVCSKCGSDNVRLDAYAEWDVDAQEWALCSTMDAAVCEGECEDECSLEEVEI